MVTDVTELSLVCPDCDASQQRYETTGDAVVCTCGTVHASDDFVWPEDERPSRPAPEVPRDSRVQVVRVGDLAARTTVRLLRPVEDAELVRVRRVLYELRPERGGPLGGDTPASVPEPRASVPTRGGGLGADVPRGAFSRPSPRSPGAVAADRVEALRPRGALPPRGAGAGRRHEARPVGAPERHASPRGRASDGARAGAARVRRVGAVTGNVPAPPG